MKKKLPNAGFKTLLIATSYLMMFAGCNNNKKNVQPQPPKAVELSQEAKCEVSVPASTVRNGLLAPAENIKYSMIKLHELGKDHHHELVTEQADYLTEQSFSLLKNSVYLTTHYLDSLIEYGTLTSVKANNLLARNHSMSRAQINSVIDEMVRLSDTISMLTDRKILINKKVCMSSASMLENQIRVYFSILNTGMALIRSTKESQCNTCLAGEVAFYEALIKSFREELIKAPTNQYKIVSRSLSDLEHSLHELTTAHEEEEVHHSLETIERQMNRLESELLDITGRNSI
tara:strand:+ start:4646 stop:5512 length:867 start_codon:yes stop_codon:yes gene_type:complete